MPSAALPSTTLQACPQPGLPRPRRTRPPQQLSVLLAGALPATEKHQHVEVHQVRPALSEGSGSSSGEYLLGSPTAARPAPSPGGRRIRSPAPPHPASRGRSAPGRRHPRPGGPRQRSRHRRRRNGRPPPPLVAPPPRQRTSGRSKRTPLRPGVASKSPARSRPCPPPTSTTVPMLERSLTARRASARAEAPRCGGVEERPVLRVRPEVVPEAGAVDARKVGSPVRTAWGSSSSPARTKAP